jgi:hypothetical protein
MEKPAAKFFLIIFMLSAVVWLYASSMKHFESGIMLKFGTVEFKEQMDPAGERAAYRSIAQNSLVTFISYPFVLLAGLGFIMTTRRSLKREGWLMMSAILLYVFVPVELYCYWLDWKIVGLNYWGNWPLEEFRKVLLMRLTALAGLPFIAQMCYYTIPIFIIFKPLQKIET